jgi:CBS domain-containing protein
MEISIRIGKISGIEIKINYSWLLIYALLTWSIAANYLPSQFPDKSGTFYWSIGAISALALFTSVLIHELAHSWVAQSNEMGIRSITLHFFGGVSELEDESKTPGIEMRMAAVGPITSLIIGVVLVGTYTVLGEGVPDFLRAVLQYSGFTNLGLAFFNTIPAFPMDGGRVLRAFLWRRNNDILKATRWARTISIGISFVFMFLGFASLFIGAFGNGLWLVVLGIFLRGAAEAEMSHTIISKALGDLKIKDIMTKDVIGIEPDLSLETAVTEYFQKYKHNGFPVVDDGELVGIVTDQDVREVDSDRRGVTSIADVMRPRGEVITVEPDDVASDALLKMARNDVGRLPVMEGGKMIGIVTRSDFTRSIKMKTQLDKETSELAEALNS